MVWSRSNTLPLWQMLLIGEPSTVDPMSALALNTWHAYEEAIPNFNPNSMT